MRGTTLSPDHDADHAFLQHVIHVDPRMRQHCGKSQFKPFLKRALDRIPIQEVQYKRRTLAGLTEQLGAISASNSHKLVLPSRMEWEISGHVIDFPVES